MKWFGTDGWWFRCRISSDFAASVWRAGDEWAANLEFVDEHQVLGFGNFPTEAAAKKAVTDWVGRTSAQLGNALADTDEPRYYVTDAGRKALLPDDGA